MKYRFVFLLLALTSGLRAEMREWTSASDPTRKIKGEFQQVEGNLVTLKLADGRTVKFEINKLSADDQIYIKNGGKMPEPKVSAPAKEPFDANRSLAGIILDFKMGENPDEVYVRLKKHGGLKGGVNEILRGRTGLSDHYYIELGGIRYGLFFEFEDGLYESSFQSAGFSADDYATGLNEAWLNLRASVAKEFGKPDLEGAFPEKDSLQEGQALSTAIWKTESGRQLYLGVGFQDGKYSCVLKTGIDPYIP